MTNKQIDLTLEQVETIKDMSVKLNVVSVYDLDVYTSMELYYKLANKVNEIINELWRFETTLSKELIEQNKELEFLLNEGLVIEVSKKVISLIDDGTISNLINNKIFKGLDEKISVLDSKLENNTININTLNSNSPYINILKCGAKLDGVTDDSSALLLATEYNKPIYIPQGNMYIGKPVVIENKDSFEIYGLKNSIISVKSNIEGILIQNSQNIKIHDLYFDCSNQNGLTHANNQMIRILNCDNVRIYDNELYNGSMGLKLDTINMLDYNNNKHTNFTGWGVVFSNIKNGNIYNNLSHDNGYDGLKGSGTFESVNVYNNTCYNNTSDGFDFAGHSCKKLRVYNNNFYNNGIDGIEIKTLNRETYPLPCGVNPVFQEIEVYDNLLSDNKQSQINIANTNSDTITSKNILVKNNNIKTFETYSVNKHGIRIASIISESNEDFIIENNTMDVKGCNKGIRCISSKNMKIRNNYVCTRGAGIETENQNSITVSGILIEHNNIKSTDGTCVNIKSDSHNTIVRFNTCLSPSTQYRVNDSGSDSIIYSNYVNVNISDISELPRGTKGDIVYSSDMSISGCQGWVKTQNGTTVSQWKQFGVIV